MSQRRTRTLARRIVAFEAKCPGAKRGAVLYFPCAVVATCAADFEAVSRLAAPSDVALS